MEECHEFPGRLRIVDVAGAVQRRDQVVAGQSQRRPRTLGVHAVEIGKESVDHRVAHEMDALRGCALVGEVRDRIGAGAQQQIR